MAGSIISYYETDFVVTPIMLSLLTLISTCELIWYLHKIQRSWTSFLLSIQHQDFNRHYQDQSEFPQLQEAYDLITQSFENLKTNKHADYRLLQTVSEHIQIGLVCYRKNGEVVFSNKTIKSILGLEAFLNIESLRNLQVNIFDCLTSDHTVSGALVKGKNEQRILIKTEVFSLQNKSYKLASLYDIKSILDTNELESYQKLRFYYYFNG
jgi:signal transduction histidine kinase